MFFLAEGQQLEIRSVGIDIPNLKRMLNSLEHQAASSINQQWPGRFSGCEGRYKFIKVLCHSMSTDDVFPMPTDDSGDSLGKRWFKCFQSNHFLLRLNQQRGVDAGVEWTSSNATHCWSCDETKGRHYRIRYLTSQDRAFCAWTRCFCDHCTVPRLRCGLYPSLSCLGLAT